ncbi:MAG: ankyrin repeat domain-containing protein, partial [Roseofilum sp. SID3]|uniref:ankyrin repeat domain-containing protein n=1 Tax=unclassified Roseofilum TaxID=2620099 RepID=UPI001B184C58
MEPQSYQTIHFLAEEGNIPSLNIYLQYIGSPNIAVGGITPLYLAAREGHFEVVRLLVEYGAEVNPKASDGYPAYSPIFAAIYHKRDRIVEFLLKNGVELDTALCAVMVYTEEKNVMEELMKAYSVDLREKIVKAHLVE